MSNSTLGDVCARQEWALRKAHRGASVGAANQTVLLPPGRPHPLSRTRETVECSHPEVHRSLPAASAGALRCQHCAITSLGTTAAAVAVVAAHTFVTW
jgi:hypothetical protein